MESDIHSAIRKGFFHQIRFLLQLGHNVNRPDEFSRSPLILCSLVDDDRWAVGLARMLLEAGASPSRADRAGRNAIHYACVLQRVDLLRVLLAAIDFDVNRTDREGNTPLHYAVATGNVDATRLAIDACVRYGCRVDIVNHEDQTPLQIALTNQSDVCVRLIREGTRLLTERAEGRGVGDSTAGVNDGGSRTPERNVNGSSWREGVMCSRSDKIDVDKWRSSVQQTSALPLNMRQNHLHKYNHQQQQQLQQSQQQQQNRINSSSAQRKRWNDNIIEKTLEIDDKENRSQVFNGHEEETGGLSKVRHSALKASTSNSKDTPDYFRSLTAASIREKRASPAGMVTKRSSTVATPAGLRGPASPVQSSPRRSDQARRVCDRLSAHHSHSHGGNGVEGGYEEGRGGVMHRELASDIVELKRFTEAGPGQPRNDPYNISEMMSKQQGHTSVELSRTSFDLGQCRSPTRVVRRGTGAAAPGATNNEQTKTWRNGIRELYESYGYQFTPSFCRPAKPPPAASVTGETDPTGGGSGGGTIDEDVHPARRLTHGRRQSIVRYSSAQERKLSTHLNGGIGGVGGGRGGRRQTITSSSSIEGLSGAGGGADSHGTHRLSHLGRAKLSTTTAVA